MFPITYLDGEEAVSLISKSSAGIILCEKGLEGFIDQYGQRLEDLHMKHERQQLVFVDNPRAVFIKIVNKMFFPKNVKTGVSPTAIISVTASIGSDCYIGNNAIVGEECAWEIIL